MRVAIRILTLLFTFSLAASQAQQPAPAAGTSLPTLKVSTRLVVVDVVAVDSKGHPLPDLKAEDFSVLEEGTSQSIRVFSFQQPAPAGEAEQAPPKLPANLITNVPTYKPNRALSVLLLDGLNTDSLAQKYARQEMLKYLEKLPQTNLSSTLALTHMP